MKVGILEEAEADLEAAHDYYESRKPGLGIEMLDEYRRGLDAINRHPDGWRIIAPGHRCFQLARFPYGIIYRMRADMVVVVAFGHLARMPNWWKYR